LEVEEILSSAKASGDGEGVKVEEETIVFEKKTIAPQTTQDDGKEEEIDPMNSPISKILVDRAEERKRKMKDFNYKFHHNQSRIEDIEKQPAYKRMGIDLDEKTPAKEGNLSRTTLSTDENEDIQLRSNNSFLHDNVD
jgi:cell division protein FtsZ